MAPFGGRHFRLAIGESLVFEFSILKNNATGRLRANYKDMETTAAADESELVTTDYTPILDIVHEDQDQSSFGTITAEAGSPSTIKLVLTDTESAALGEGIYYGTITLVNTVDTDETIEAIHLNFELFDEVEVQSIPVSAEVVRDCLNIPTDYPIRKVQRSVNRAINDALFLLNSDVILWTRKFGWPTRIITEVEELAMLYVIEKEYDAAEGIEDKIADQKKKISNIAIDTEEDGVMDTGGAGSINIVGIGLEDSLTEIREEESIILGTIK